MIEKTEYWFIISVIIVNNFYSNFYNMVQSNISRLKQVWRHIYEYFFITFSINTIIITLGVFGVALFLGIIAAWITVFYDFYFKNIYLFTYYTNCYSSLCCSLLLCRYNRCRRDTIIFFRIFKFGTTTIFSSFVRSIQGAIFILSITLFPYVYLIARFSFANNSKKIIEAAANLELIE